MATDETLRRKLDRARAEIRLLEDQIEDRTRSLYLAQQSLQETADFLGQVLATMDSAVFVVDAAGMVASVNNACCTLLGGSESEVVGTPWHRFVELRDAGTGIDSLVRKQAEGILRLGEGTSVPVLFSGSAIRDDKDRTISIVCVATDLTALRGMEAELRQAQKLESLGQLATGIAHEINTPIQFVGDSLSFLEEAFRGLEGVLEAHAALCTAAAKDDVLTEERRALDEVRKDADLEFLLEEVPAAFGRARDGASRVARIVGAMKEFSHPGTSKKTPADLNEAIEATLTVSQNEYKYVADLETSLGQLPPVTCEIGDVNQVVLNLVVNAAHAIEEQARGGGERGSITVSTWADGDQVVVEVRDTGAGIPPEIAHRVFEPFFTTKEVGRGTGQGLSIAHHIIVDQHGGSLTFETVPGQGTTFCVRLPTKPSEARHAA